MEAKTLAVLLTILSALSVLYTQVQPQETELPENKISDFVNWKKKFGLTFKSEFEEIYR